MIVEVTKDKALIKSLMDKLSDICSDDDSAEGFEPRIDNLNGWLIVKDYDNIAGIVFVEQTTLSSITFHPYLLGEKGKGREMIKTILKWFLNIDSLHKINVSIASIYRSTYNTAKKIGFVDEGVNRESFLKDGKYHDQLLLGLTKPEIEALL